MLTNDQACAVPLLEQMRRIPADWREMRETGYCAHQNVPYGRMLHEAADEIERLRTGLTVLRGRLLNAGARCEGMKIEPGMSALINDMIDRVEALGIDGSADEPGCRTCGGSGRVTEIRIGNEVNVPCPSCTPVKSGGGT